MEKEKLVELINKLKTLTECVKKVKEKVVKNK